ncbi:MAG TPA: hypothetical protein VL793_14345 [Patescibacteria group bacterium]|jgi:hypothetical protein|nr:hypothetical protein [Patescibacteria group bacterium]
MSETVAAKSSLELGTLLRGEPESLNSWVQEWNVARVIRALLLIVAGAGLYGCAMGCSRAPAQALFVAIKFPLIILLTTGGNALLNSMLAPLLGLRIGWRQSFLAILLSFVIAAAILGSFSPLVVFMVWNSPPMSATTPDGHLAYNAILLLHVATIALAGIMANVRLARLLTNLSGSASVGRRVLVAWLAGNLFLGSQVSWILRPFIGSPDLPVQFLRDNALHGNFYETVFHSLLHVLKGIH